MSDYVAVTALVSASFAGGIVAGFAGFAFSAVAGSILLHFFEPALAIPLMMLCSITAQLGSLAYLRGRLRFTQSVSFLIGGLLGVPVAVSLFHLIDPLVFRRCFGLFLSFYAGYMLLRPQIVLFQGGAISNTAVGFVGGVIRGIYRYARRITNNLVRSAGHGKRSAARDGSALHRDDARPCSSDVSFAARQATIGPLRQCVDLPPGRRTWHVRRSEALREGSRIGFPTGRFSCLARLGHGAHRLTGKLMLPEISVLVVHSASVFVPEGAVKPSAG